MGMEKIIVTTSKNGLSYKEDGSAIHGTAYEEFMRWRPTYSGLGQEWLNLFGDAVRSLILNTESVQKVNLGNKVNQIVDISKRYARIYYATEGAAREADSSRALFIFRGVLMDLVRDYNYMDPRYDDLVDGLYKKICDLIRVGR